ncbi:MAG TPA: NYN domain-containing protein [bacterium]|nr:NYN domain-containing protein [bacterium]HOM27779.1 NYN domain-containing protein [bacterium]
MERVFIFIDGSNFYHGLKEEIGIRTIDFLKFAFKPCGKRKFVGANYYNVPLKKEYAPDKYKDQQKFFNYIRNLPGYTLKLGHLELRNVELKKGTVILENSKAHVYFVGPIDKVNEILKKDESKTITQIKYLVEKGVDISIATDMLSLAYDDFYDTGILVSGDGDFAYVIKKIQQLKKKIEVAYFPQRKCWHLRQVSDKFISLEKSFFEDLERKETRK